MYVTPWFITATAVLWVEERVGSIACETESSHDCCLLGCDAVQIGISSTEALTDFTVFIIRLKWIQQGAMKG